MSGLLAWIVMSAGSAVFHWASGQSASAPQAAAPPPPAVRAAATPVPAVAAAAAAQAVAPAASSFEAYKAYLAGRARREGVREATIQAHVPGLQFNRRVVELDRAQAPSPRTQSTNRGFDPFEPYRQRHVTSSLINRGRARYSQHYANLARVQARFGVDAPVLMAIYGHETSYGAVTGSFDLLEVLASLAYDGRRRAMFENEFIAALKLTEIGIPRYRLKGSYAGATGYPQFMPSTVARLRADGDMDGYADLWANEVDGLASIANYLREAGWKANVPWGVAVRTPPTLNRAAIRNHLVAPRCPRVFERHSRWLTMREWRALGVVPYGRSLADNEMASLIEPDGPNATAYLLTTNYKAILDYNCSNYYALSVGLLADAIAGR